MDPGSQYPPYGDPLALLEEWFGWWIGEGPAKMPNALHIRTAMALQTRDRISPESISPRELDDGEMLDQLLDATTTLHYRIKEQLSLGVDAHPADHLPVVVESFGPVDVGDDAEPTCDEGCTLEPGHDGPCVPADDGP